jgi:hypothetical protein
VAVMRTKRRMIQASKAGSRVCNQDVKVLGLGVPIALQEGAKRLITDPIDLSC